MRSAWAALARVVQAIASWRWLKPIVFAVCLLPLVEMVHGLWQVLSGRDQMALGVEPAKSLLHQSGETALVVLLLSLSITPARRIFQAAKLHNLRRMLGLWAFTYALAHLSVYLAFDQLCYSFETCEWNAVWQDILKRPFIFVGQLSFFIMLLLAITSTNGWQRRLRKNWTRLHRLVYVAAIAGVVHFIWIQKSDISEPLKYGYWLGVLLIVRIYFAVMKIRAVSARSTP